jgi:hypothetical protein
MPLPGLDTKRRKLFVGLDFVRANTASTGAIEFAHTEHVFRDLDWLIPADLQKPSDIVKRLLFTDTIEHGHRITIYLRSLLPDTSKISPILPFITCTQ